MKNVCPINSIKNLIDLYEKKINIEDEFELIIQENKSSRSKHFRSQNKSKNLLHIYFCDIGSCLAMSSINSYAKLTQGTSLVSNISNLNLIVQKNSRLIILSINHQKLHKKFINKEDLVNNSLKQRIERNVFTINKISPLNCLVLSQISQSSSQKNTEIYIKSKAYELLSIFFHQLINEEKRSCSYFKNRKNLQKLENAKEILESNISEPPSLKELSKKAMLPFSKLQEGFKEIYGYTLYNYLIHHKMMISIRLLESKKMTIQEVALEVGYSTASHFIAAFKKKFGTTPKKYVMSLN